MIKGGIIRWVLGISALTMGWAATYVVAATDIRTVTPDSAPQVLPTWEVYTDTLLYPVSIEKFVLPEGEVAYGDELTYTVSISTSAPDILTEFYDPLTAVTFRRFVTHPTSITHTQIISGGLPVDIITGTLPLGSSPMTVSFVVRVNIPDTLARLITITNRACVSVFGGRLAQCVWSDEVSNLARWPYSLYLPLIWKQDACLSCYYVDCINGNDSNSGKAQDKAWRTLTPVRAAQFVPGAIVHFKRGCTWSGGLTLNDSGEADNPIAFTAYGEGGRPTFTNPGSSTNGITIRANYVVVERLRVQDVQINGVYVSADYGYNVIRDVEITNAGSGITLSGHHNHAIGNYIHDLHMIVNTPGGDDDYGATGIKLSGPGNEASYNRIARCVAPSYDYETDGGGFELLQTVDGSSVHHNLVIDSDGFLEVGMGSARDVVIAYNVSVNNGRFSWIHLTGTFASVVENLRVEHNTLVELGDTPDWTFLGFKGEPDHDTFVFRNNIVYVDDHGVISNAPDFTHEHNLYYLEGGTALGFTPGPGEQMADPLFVAVNEGDFHLQSHSSAIDSGIHLGYTKDFDGNPVPINAAPDLGAFEFAGPPESTPTPTSTPSPTPSPTPEPDEIIIDDADAGFSTSFSQDEWQLYTYAGGQHYGDAHHYNREIGTGADTATWTFTVPEPGSYAVYAWWWAGSWRPEDVPYTINHLNGSTTIRVSQQISGAQWNLLGTFEFQDQGSIMVSDDVSSHRDVAADAVRLVYLAPLAFDRHPPIATVTATPAPSPMLLTPTPTPTALAPDVSSQDKPIASSPELPAMVGSPPSQPTWLRVLVTFFQDFARDGSF